MGGLLHLVQPGGKGPGWAVAPPSLLSAVSNVTAHPSTASVSITVLLYDGPFLCSFNMAIKGLNMTVLLLTNEVLHFTFLQTRKDDKLRSPRTYTGNYM